MIFDLATIGSKLISKGLTALGKKVLGKKGMETVEKISGFLGLDDPKDLEKALDDPAVIKELHDYEIRMGEIELENMKSAREMKIKTGDTYVDRLSEEIMKKNVIYILILAVLNAVLIFLSKKLNIEPAIVVALANVFGMIIQSLLQERKDVTGFWLGSSIGSKLKDLRKEKENHV